MMMHLDETRTIVTLSTIDYYEEEEKRKNENQPPAADGSSRGARQGSNDPFLVPTIAYYKQTFRRTNTTFNSYKRTLS